LLTLNVAVFRIVLLLTNYSTIEFSQVVKLRIIIAVIDKFFRICSVKIIL